jgi:urease accessory protein
MLKAYERLPEMEKHEADDSVTLTYEQRERARVLAKTHSGEEIGIFLKHGKPMRVGELLRTLCGKTIRVTAAMEPVTKVTTENWLLFSRACYHLGNRHVKIQIEERQLFISPDHVLEAMLRGLGLTVTHEERVFVPESGAYAKHHHQHQHHEERDHLHTNDRTNTIPEPDYEPTA